jgi:hypothetical protein
MLNHARARRSFGIGEDARSCGAAPAQQYHEATETTLAVSKDTLKRTEAIFKKEERAREGTQAMLEYEAEERAVREKTARLRALRLAAEASKEDARDKAAAKKA